MLTRTHFSLGSSTCRSLLSDFLFPTQCCLVWFQRRRPATKRSCKKMQIQPHLVLVTKRFKQYYPDKKVFFMKFYELAMIYKLSVAISSCRTAMWIKCLVACADRWDASLWLLCTVIHITSASGPEIFWYTCFPHWLSLNF